jgi:predicted PurR-regulated permease PerM
MTDGQDPERAAEGAGASKTAIRVLALPFSFTLVTIGFALIPFGAWAAFGVASLVLVLENHAAVGALLFGYGSAVMLIGDNLVQPVLIGNSIRDLRRNV